MDDRWRVSAPAKAGHHPSSWYRFGGSGLPVHHFEVQYQTDKLAKLSIRAKHLCSSTYWRYINMISIRDAKSSKPKWSQGQNIGLSLSLKTMTSIVLPFSSVLALALNNGHDLDRGLVLLTLALWFWPHPSGLGLRSSASFNTTAKRDVSRSITSADFICQQDWATKICHVSCKNCQIVGQDRTCSTLDDFVSHH